MSQIFVPTLFPESLLLGRLEWGLGEAVETDGQVLLNRLEKIKLETNS